MKAKQYCKVFNLKDAEYFDRDQFIIQLKNDFILYLNNLGKINPKKWNNAVDDLNRKYNQIMLNTKLTIEKKEKFWNYIYATVIIKEREKIFGKNFKEAKLKYRLNTDDDFRRRYVCWKMHEEMKKEYWNQFNDFYSNLLNNFLVKIRVSNENEARKILGVPLNIKIDLSVIKFAYWEKSKSCHPDIGGNKEDFIKIQKAKEYLEEIYKSY